MIWLIVGVVCTLIFFTIVKLVYSWEDLFIGLLITLAFAAFAAVFVGMLYGVSRGGAELGWWGSKP